MGKLYGNEAKLFCQYFQIRWNNSNSLHYHNRFGCARGAGELLVCTILSLSVRLISVSEKT